MSATKELFYTTLVACIFAAPPPAWSVEPRDGNLFSLSLEELGQLKIRSVDFFETSLTRSPSNVKVITHEDIADLPALTLRDFIQLYVPGAHVAAQGDLGSNFGSRGLSRGGGAKTLGLWDGHSLNFRGMGGFRTGFFSHLLGDLEQIEVVLGPGSLVHGNGAFHGFINFVPKNGKDHPGLKSRVDWGLHDDLIRFDSAYGHVYGEDRNFFLYGGYMQAAGYVFNDDFGGSTFNARRFAQKEVVAEYEPSFKLSGTWTHERFQLTSMFEHLQPDPGAIVQQSNQLLQRSVLTLQPRYTHSFASGDSLEFAPSLTLLDTSSIRSPRTATAPPETQDGGSESLTELRVIYQTGRISGHKIAVGGTYSWRDLRSREQFFSSDADIDPRNAVGGWQEYAVFVEDRIEITPRWALTLGLREDRTRFKELRLERPDQEPFRFTPNNVSNLSPRVVVNFELNPRHAFRLSYQEGFQYPLAENFPRLAEVNQVLIAAGETPFPGLQPDTIQSLELGYYGRFLDETLSSQLTLYYNRNKNPLVFRNFRSDPPILDPEIVAMLPPGVGGLVFNTDFDFDSVGGEFSLTWQPNRRFRGSLGYAYAAPSDLSAEANQILAQANDSLTEWQFFPKHQIKTNVDFRLERWSFNVSALFESGVDRDLNAFDGPYEDDHVRVNAIAHYRFLDNLRLSFLVKNLFKNGAPPIGTNNFPFNGNLGSDERTFYLRLAWRPARP